VAAIGDFPAMPRPSNQPKTRNHDPQPLASPFKAA